MQGQLLVQQRRKASSHVSVSADNTLHVALEQSYVQSEVSKRSIRGQPELTDDVNLCLPNDVGHSTLTLPHPAQQGERG